MPAPESMLDLYLHLACAADADARPIQRDKFLILAAGIAQTVGYAGIAEDCRLRVLENNPNHLLRQFATVREALRSSEVRYYIRQLLRLYPFEKAEFLLMKYRDGGYQGHHGYDSLHASEDRPGQADPETRDEGNEGRASSLTDRGPRSPRSRNRPRGQRRPGSRGGTRPRPALERAFREQAKANERAALATGTTIRPLRVPSVPELRPKTARRLPVRLWPSRGITIPLGTAILLGGMMAAGAGAVVTALLVSWL